MVGGISSIEDDKQIQGAAKDLPQRPEGVYTAGNVLKVTVADGEGAVETVYFRDQTEMQTYLAENYPKATAVTNDTRFYALDSLEPFVPPNQYISTSTEVWTTTPSPGNKTSEIDGIVTAFVDKNPPGTQPHQITLKEQRAIGVWKDTNEATEFYKRTQPDKTIRDSGVLGNAATSTNPVKPNEIYLQPRPITNIRATP